MLKSKSKAQYLQRVFHWSDEDERKLMVQAARLAILYQDFQLELEGVMAEKIAPLDAHGAEARRLYFLRRHSLSFDEIGNAIRLINSNRFWKHLRKGIAREHLASWNQAVTFFHVHKGKLSAIRNDVGGHVLDGAAAFAIENIRPTTVGVIEAYERDRGGADVRPKFAHELVAIALKRTMPPGTDEETFFAELFSFMAETMRHVVRAVHVLSYVVLWPRF